MYLSKYLILSLIVLCGLSYNNLVDANAGLIKPIPKYPCSNSETDGCKIRNPCHRTSKIDDDVNPIDINEGYEFAIYQLLSKANSSSTNTYTVQYFVDEGEIGYQLFTFNQADITQDNSSYAITMDPIANNEKLMDNVQFSKEGYAFGTLELTFDARSGGGKVYYSCAYVRLQKKPISQKKGNNLEVQSTIDLTDNKGDSLGDIESDNTPKELFIPSLIPHNAVSESSDIANKEDADINPKSSAEDEKEKAHENSSNKLLISITFIGLLSSLISLF